MNSEEILTYLILIVIGYFIAKMFNRCTNGGNGFRVGGKETWRVGAGRPPVLQRPDGTKGKCEDVATKGKIESCAKMFETDGGNCPYYYEVLNGKKYFCVEDADASFLWQCKRDSMECNISNNYTIIPTAPWRNYTTKGYDFIGGSGTCDECGGCGKPLDRAGRTVCKDNSSHWCYNTDKSGRYVCIDSN